VAGRDDPGLDRKGRTLTPSPLDAWVLARLVYVEAGLNGELGRVSARLRPLARVLDSLPREMRDAALQVYVGERADGEEIVRAIAAIDPNGPLPEAVPLASFATLADIARTLAEQRWLWEGWIAIGVLNVVASEPGVGKTRFAMDLARRFWFGLPMPDGQVNPLPAGTSTLWIQGDRNFSEMLTVARAFGLPDEAVALGSSPDEPTGSLNLDDLETLVALAERIEAVRPALVVIDTVGMVTSRNLCRPEEAREFFAPILDLAGKHGVAFLGLTHLSKDKEALGRRIVEKARVIIKMTQPDREGQPNRRRLWVDKAAVVLAHPLGITMGESGNDYDFDPPAEPKPIRTGRPPESTDKARQFIIKALSEQNDRRATTLCKEWEASGESDSAFWRARDVMRDSGDLTCEGKPLILHLNQGDDDSDPEG
jgi:hypothetical protein